MTSLIYGGTHIRTCLHAYTTYVYVCISIHPSIHTLPCDKFRHSMVEHTYVHAYMFVTCIQYICIHIHPFILYYDYNICWCVSLTSLAYPQFVAPAVSRFLSTLLPLWHVPVQSSGCQWCWACKGQLWYQLHEECTTRDPCNACVYIDR